MNDSSPADKLRSDLPLAEDWRDACAANARAQDRWEVVDGGRWTWASPGARVEGTGPEWLALRWVDWNAEAARTLKNFMIEVTIRGEAEAAGLSFGGYKDFLANVSAHTGPRHLQLEIDVEANCWAFRVDGQLMRRCWWDSAVTGVEDILHGGLRLKVRRARDVVFEGLALRNLEASCRLSVIVTCYRFVQRLRLSLRNWCHQDLPSGALEVLVVNPQSPDGTHEHLAAVTRSFPHVRVREVVVDAALGRNKGAMINHAFALSRGEWIWLTDADCLFPPDSAARVLAQVWGRPRHLFFGERRFLTPGQTDSLLSGRVDALRQFDEIAHAADARGSERHPWGYTQIVHRSTLQRLPYQETLNHFAHSDGIFIEECKRHRILPVPVEGLFCLHLDHPFSWYGTDTFL